MSIDPLLISRLLEVSLVQGTQDLYFPLPLYVRTAWVLHGSGESIDFPYRYALEPVIALVFPAGEYR